jgi:hypothetical protein
MGHEDGNVLNNVQEVQVWGANKRLMVVIQMALKFNYEPIKCIKMKILSTLAGLALVLVFTTNVHAQKIEVIEGSIDTIKSDTLINFEFVYDSMKVSKFDKEDDFITKYRDEGNKREKGAGDAWAKAWVADREAKYEPKFEALFMKYSEKKRSRDAKYTLIFKTTFTEPGYPEFWSGRKPTEINGDVWIVETADRNNVIAKLIITKARGSSSIPFANSDTSVRIAEAYANAGKTLGEYLGK